MLATCRETITSGKFVCIFITAILDEQTHTVNSIRCCYKQTGNMCAKRYNGMKIMVPVCFKVNVNNASVRPIGNVLYAETTFVTVVIRETV